MFFDGTPDAAEVEARLAETPAFANLPPTSRDPRRLCAYDIVDFHSLGDYTEILTNRCLAAQ